MSIFTLSLFCEIIGWRNKNQTIGHCWSKMPNISQVSVATYLTCGTIFNDQQLYCRCLSESGLKMKEFWTSSFGENHTQAHISAPFGLTSANCPFLRHRVHR